ncbi:hypothetical protein PR003_g21959 [Phytophthora rubi]|uniref:Ecp2 effector protein domain-containing protein n=1 Tax=Phytophthora rubi TaxID=129364 RepID=A0A6A3J718_9STRA|nr:hypothetical protein PR002_g22041 [Phytophthora rubi]KAE8990231.1 hypothetical protein PR001_g21550 [Phytophthora rubi]KAE9303610.1 hypothetical protein PR003_g21959 [Phytophthora rubi]
MNMLPMRLLLLVVIVWTKECAGVAEDVKKFTGSVSLYAGTNYQHLLLNININTPNRCFNINCTYIDDRVASANWNGLPTTGLDGKAYITFYAGYNCKGNHTSAQLPHDGGVREFVYPDGISAFMVRSESRKRLHGSADVCSWTGASVIGGYVVEEFNDSR